MKYALLIVGLMVANGWTVEGVLYTPFYVYGSTIDITELDDEEKPAWEVFNANDYVVVKSTYAEDENRVFHSTHIRMTLDEFVKSGKFCEWRGGHKWVTGLEGITVMPNYEVYHCLYCDRLRKKIPIKREVTEWEWEE